MCAVTRELCGNCLWELAGPGGAVPPGFPGPQDGKASEIQKMKEEVDATTPGIEVANPGSCGS